MTEAAREHRLTFKSSGFHTPIEATFDVDASGFRAILKTTETQLELVLTCPAPDTYDMAHVRRVEEQASRIALHLRGRLHLALTDLGADCDASEIHCVARDHPPIAGPDHRLFAASAGIKVGGHAARLVTLLNGAQMALLAQRVGRLEPISVGEQFFLDAERVADPMAKLVLLWSGLSILFHTEEHGELDTKLRAVDPSIPMVSVEGRKGKVVQKSVIRAARDQIAHLGEKNPAGIEKARSDASAQCSRLRRLFVRALAQDATGRLNGGP